MSKRNFNVPAPAVGVPPFLINNLPNERGKHWYITGDVGGDVFYTLDERYNTAQEIIDNGAVLKPDLNGVEKYLQFPNLNELKIVFQSTVGTVYIEKVAP